MSTPKPHIVLLDILVPAWAASQDITAQPHEHRDGVTLDILRLAYQGVVAHINEDGCFFTWEKAVQPLRL